MTKRIFLTLAMTCLIAGCASSQKDMTLEDKRNAAIKKCFDDFPNYPTQRNACINNVRTAAKYNPVDEK